MRKILLSLAVAATAIIPASAQEFFDTSEPDQLFNIGARVGVNTSNRTLKSSLAFLWNHNSWGTGFDAGVVADINIRNYLSIQPGFFYESRSGAFVYQTLDYAPSMNYEETVTQLGKGREYLFTIPVVGSLHLNILDNMRWDIDFGPYIQFKLKSTFDHKFDYPMVTLNGPYYFANVRTSKVDVGFKMGMGLDIFKHYYIGFHYLAGMCHAWNPGELGGHNKEWLFTIGYTFF